LEAVDAALPHGPFVGGVATDAEGDHGSFGATAGPKRVREDDHLIAHRAWVHRKYDRFSAQPIFHVGPHGCAFLGAVTGIIASILQGSALKYRQLRPDDEVKGFGQCVYLASLM
jgi:hypothetical protein